MSGAIEIITRSPDPTTETVSPLIELPELLNQLPNRLPAEAPFLPVAMTVEARKDVYQKAGEAAEQQEDGRQNPAMSNVPSREVQEARRAREQGGSSMTYGEDWKRHITTRLAAALGYLGLRPTILT